MRKYLQLLLVLLIAGLLQALDFNELKNNVKRNHKGMVVIDGIPQVAQRKSYCAPATISMVLRYYDGNLNQKKLAKVFDTSRKHGTKLGEIIREFSRGGVAGFDFKPLYVKSGLDVSELYQEYFRLMKYSQKKQEKAMKLLEKQNYSECNVKVFRQAAMKTNSRLVNALPAYCELIDNGIPLIWCCILDFDPYNKMPGGHMRMIVGYVKNPKGELTGIIYRDPWGNATRMRHMPVECMVAMTDAICVIVPGSVKKK